jgi:hypothetical protein
MDYETYSRAILTKFKQNNMIEIRVRHQKTTKSKIQTKLEFVTMEEIPESEIQQIDKTPGYLFFKEDKFSQEQREIMKNKKFGMDDKGMRPSQKLRGKLMDIWEAKGSQKSFEQFYKDSIDHLIDNLSKKYGV